MHRLRPLHGLRPHHRQVHRLWLRRLSRALCPASLGRERCEEIISNPGTLLSPLSQSLLASSKLYACIAKFKPYCMALGRAGFSCC